MTSQNLFANKKVCRIGGTSTGIIIPPHFLQLLDIPANGSVQLELDVVHKTLLVRNSSNAVMPQGQDFTPPVTRPNYAPSPIPEISPAQWANASEETRNFWIEKHKKPTAPPLDYINDIRELPERYKNALLTDLRSKGVFAEEHAEEAQNHIYDALLQYYNLAIVGKMDKKSALELWNDATTPLVNIYGI